MLLHPPFGQDDCTIRCNEEQKAWLRKDLAAVDRSKTPWVIALSHYPMYMSQKPAVPFQCPGPASCVAALGKLQGGKSCCACLKGIADCPAPCMQAFATQPQGACDWGSILACPAACGKPPQDVPGYDEERDGPLSQQPWFAAEECEYQGHARSCNPEGWVPPAPLLNATGGPITAAELEPIFVSAAAPFAPSSKPEKRLHRWNSASTSIGPATYDSDTFFVAPSASLTGKHYYFRSTSTRPSTRRCTPAGWSVGATTTHRQ